MLSDVTMDAKSKILFFFLLILLVASIALTYYRTMILRDYPVLNLPSGEEGGVIEN